MLGRRGNKTRLAKYILPYFPKHETYIEPFFGGGGMFFAKPKARFNILNDIDSQVYNFYKVVMERRDELLDYLKFCVLHQRIFKEEAGRVTGEAVRDAAWFFVCGLNAYMGDFNTLTIQSRKPTKYYESKINTFFERMQDVYFTNVDFREVFKQANIKKAGVFIYADPPYIGTDGIYAGFTEADFTDLVDMLKNTGHNFAISEYKGVATDIAVKNGLFVTEIGARSRLSGGTECLITNYETNFGTIFTTADLK